MPSEARHPRDGADEGPRSTGPRLVHAWSVLDRDRRLAAIAAALLFATMLLPWYQQNAVVSTAKSQPLVSRNLNAFAVFSFVEAAVLLVAVAVLVLLYERAEGRTFHLPGGDGSVLFAAGLWTALLLVLRLFDKPGIAHNGVAANVGIQWGIFFALGAAGLLAYAGSRIRAMRRPEPPLMRDGPPATRRARQPAASDPHAGRARDTPTTPEGAPARHAPTEDDPTVLLARRAAHTEAVTPAGRLTAQSASTQLQDDASPPPSRPRYPPSPAKQPLRTPTPASSDQLSFEDSPPAE